MPNNGFTYNAGTGEVTIAPPPGGDKQKTLRVPPEVLKGPPPPKHPTIPPGGWAGWTEPTDWSSMLGIYGLPADVQAKVNQIFSSTTDVSQATALALAYIRGTSWYAGVYPGIKEGMANGTVANEADYRAYLNNVNALAHQYLGRDIGGQEIADYLKQGFNVDRISRIYQGSSIANTSGNDWRYTLGAFDSNGQLSAEEAKAYGQEQAGIDTPLGQRVQQRLALAQQRMQTVFNGSTAGLTQNGRAPAPSSGQQAPDIAA